MAPIELIRSFLQQASAHGARSTALNSLGWLVAMLIPGLITCAAWSTSPWVAVLFAIALALAVAVYLGAYIYFMLVDPDALRSERFTLSKMALERQAIGDNVVGLMDASDASVVTHNALPLPKSENAA